MVKFGKRRQAVGKAHSNSIRRTVACEGSHLLRPLDLLKPMLLEQRQLAGGELPELIRQQAQLYVGNVAGGFPEFIFVNVSLDASSFALLSSRSTAA